MQKMNAEGAALQGSGWVVSLSSLRECYLFYFMDIPGPPLCAYWMPYCFYLVLSRQWLALDKEMKKIRVETTANQVNFMRFINS